MAEAHISLEEGFNVVNGSVAANQDPKSVRVNLFGKTNPNSKLVSPLKVKLNFRKKKISRKVTPLKLKINKRKFDQSLSTLEENTESGLDYSQKKNKNTAVETIRMKLSMKQVVRIERSKETESFLHQNKNIDVTEEETEMTQFTLDGDEEHGNTEDETLDNIEEEDKGYIKVDNVFEDDAWENIQDEIKDENQVDIQQDDLQDIQNRVHHSIQYEVIPQWKMGQWRNGGG